MFRLFSQSTVSYKLFPLTIQCQSLQSLFSIIEELRQEVAILHRASQADSGEMDHDRTLAGLKHGIMSELLERVDAEVGVFQGLLENSNQDGIEVMRELLDNLNQVISEISEHNMCILSLPRGISHQDLKVAGVGTVATIPLGIITALEMITLPAVALAVGAGLGIVEIGKRVTNFHDSHTRSESIILRLGESIANVQKELSGMREARTPMPGSV